MIQDAGTDSCISLKLLIHPYPEKLQMIEEASVILEDTLVTGLVTKYCLIKEEDSLATVLFNMSNGRRGSCSRLSLYQ